MTSIFPVENRPSGEETEPFMHTLQPIIDQLAISKIPPDHHVTTIFTLLNGKAREIASHMNLANLDTEGFVLELKRKLLFDYNVQQRKLNRWNDLKFSTFRQGTSSLHKATSLCIDHVSQHFKDLPEFMANDQSLLERLRSIFRQESWCLSLYEKAVPTMKSSGFAELLKTAASNYDQRQVQTVDATRNTGTYKCSSTRLS